MPTLIESLVAGEVRLELIRTDGSVQVFRATTRASMIGDAASDGIPNRTRLGMLTAWDLDAGIWRAFKPGQVGSWSPG